MSFNEAIFSKNNLDLCLRELAKEFRKLNGKSMPAEIILIGGASVLINYGFRDTTYDMDAIIITTLRRICSARWRQSMSDHRRPQASPLRMPVARISLK